MTYEQALEKIHSLDKIGSKPGLERVKMLFDMLKDDLLKQSFIHVAGTNGKGSVCSMISSILTCEGYKTGLFISPYITDFRERIQINNHPVSKEILKDAVEKIWPLLEKLNKKDIIITEFEFVTALAFYIYKQEKCEYIVCEVGMGGLLDSTNLIESPICSVITKIDFDHTQILGETLEEIAHQKCGIIKENCISVTSSQCKEVLEIIKTTSRQKHSMLFYSSDVKLEDIRFSLNNTSFIYKNIPMSIELLGKHQIDNLRTALSVIDAIKLKNIKVNIQSTKKGLESAKNPGRFEVISKDPLIILDGAHNPGGMSSFAENVKLYTENSKRTLIIGMLKDKDIDNSIKYIDGLFEQIITVDIDNPRSEDRNVLKEILKKRNQNSFSSKTLEEALKTAKNSKNNVFICGSLYLISTARTLLIKNKMTLFDNNDPAAERYNLSE